MARHWKLGEDDLQFIELRVESISYVNGIDEVVTVLSFEPYEERRFRLPVGKVKLGDMVALSVRKLIKE